MLGWSPLKRGEATGREEGLGVFGHSEKENIESILKLDKPFYKIGDLNI